MSGQYWERKKVERPPRIQHYVAVMDEEERYTIWFADRPIPTGWHAVPVDNPKIGEKDEVLEWIGTVWTDMTPRSVREWKEKHGKKPKKSLVHKKALEDKMSQMEEKKTEEAEEAQKKTEEAEGKTEEAVVEATA